ncbi:PDR/VanB family oxidoreductase [Methylobacterium nonmethylotrophicum]|uniref:Oxidoreductase n=1 Tax=Methylobacterium nonmethylotrophicum TaxID=1141884 RepID=A0A4Z0NNZ4_9HYPH|nr:PDR/VanB family oxidoreductase [Methylobacterium nonmethylotrophicum]TGD98262.1 oxidoreductase [Methylobacterium nonmethylotrophicum]
MAPTDWLPARLRDARALTPDIRLLEIEPTGRVAPVPPGSHLGVAVMIGERPDTRSYSLLDSGADGVYRIAVKRLPDSRGGSAYMHGLAPGARLSISGPRNHFGLTLNRPDYLLVAGGIGITPLHAMALALNATGARFRLLYAARRRQDLALADDLRARLGDRLRTFLDEDGERIDLEAAIADLGPGGEAYVCGPYGMMEAARRAWAAAGRPAQGLRFETFGTGGRHATEPFTVRIPRLSKEIVVPRNQTMLEALEAAGVGMIHDCRRGECGLCTVKILGVDGTVDHRDVFFSESQKATNAHLCTCVSRVVGGGITIDTADRAG